MRISDWSSDVCSSDLQFGLAPALCPCERRELLLHRRLHPHLPRPLLRFLQAAARGGVDAWPRHLPADDGHRLPGRSAEHTSELQSLMRISYAVFCLTKNNESLLTKEYRKSQESHHA